LILDLSSTPVEPERVAMQPPPPPSVASAAPQPRPEPSSDEVLELEDIETPAFLRRERKLFQ
jgi:hypothetical protein